MHKQTMSESLPRRPVLLDDWCTDPETEELVRAIMLRLGGTSIYVDDTVSLATDLTICRNCEHVDLPTLRDATLPDFAHDICGIIRHLDRETGELPGFLPRCRVITIEEALRDPPKPWPGFAMIGSCARAILMDLKLGFISIWSLTMGKFADFGTRRVFSGSAHEEVLRAIQPAAPVCPYMCGWRRRRWQREHNQPETVSESQDERNRDRDT